MYGKKIKEGEIRLSETRLLETVGNSVDRAGAWEYLKDYFLELESDGLLEQ